MVRAAGEEAALSLRSALISFICSPLSDAVLQRLPLTIATGDGRSPSVAHLLWEQYKVPPDAAGWLQSVISVVESMPVGVTLSDMRVAGNPLIYANQEFCRLTGYSKSEVLGRNCRFLQGPDTELSGVAALVHALRNGKDCAVRITNYKRSGATFVNMLSLRAVRDSSDTRRFCIGVQCESTRLRQRVDALLRLLPLGFKSTEGPSGGFLESGALDAAPTDLRDPVRFSSEHVAMLKAVGAYDPSHIFTRMLWLCDLQTSFRALQASMTFAGSFDTYMTEYHPLALADWNVSLEI